MVTKEEFSDAMTAYEEEGGRWGCRVNKMAKEPHEVVRNEDDGSPVVMISGIDRETINYECEQARDEAALRAAFAAAGVKIQK